MPPPNGLSHFFWRFLLIGHDYYWQSHLLAKADSRAIQQHPTVTDGQNPADSTKNSSQDSIAGCNGKIQVFLERVGRMVKNDRRHLFYFPVSLPIAVVSVTLVFAGYLITSINPDFLIRGRLKNYTNLN